MIILSRNKKERYFKVHLTCDKEKRLEKVKKKNRADMLSLFLEDSQIEEAWY